jgi:hypothetical protein
VWWRLSREGEAVAKQPAPARSAPGGRRRGLGHVTRESAHQTAGRAVDRLGVFGPKASTVAKASEHDDNAATLAACATGKARYVAAGVSVIAAAP